MSTERTPWEPFDPDYTREVVDEALRPALRRYFRPRLLGARRVPAAGPLILAANHSGNAFPYDGLVLDSLLWRRDGMRPEAKLRSLFEKQLALTWWMRPFGIDNLWRRCGGVDLTFDNFDRLLARGHRVIYYPEGVAGIGKGFAQRYRLQPFHTSFVALAAKHGAPVVPVHIVNAEWVIPFNFTLRWLDRLMSRVFGVPFLPLPGAALAIAWPWTWWLTLPARMVLVLGTPIDVRAMVHAEAGASAADMPSRAVLERVAERLRHDMQAQLDGLVARYGRRPYQARLLLREMRRAWQAGELGATLPWGWLPRMQRFERNRRRPPARSRLHAMLRDWDLALFYVPFGWPLLSLARALRRPPCGYRGLSRDARREQEGRFVWRLEQRPLP